MHTTTKRRVRLVLGSWQYDNLVLLLFNQTLVKFDSKPAPTESNCFCQNATSTKHVKQYLGFLGALQHAFSTSSFMFITSTVPDTQKKTGLMRSFWPHLPYLPLCMEDSKSNTQVRQRPLPSWDVEGVIFSGPSATGFKFEGSPWTPHKIEN